MTEQDAPSKSKEQSDASRIASAAGIRRYLPGLLLIVGIGIGVIFPLTIFVHGIKSEFMPLYLRNFVVILGLPLAAFASLFLVVFLEQTQGEIELELSVLKLKGASGPIILWVVCYLAFAASFKLLWIDEKPTGAETPAVQATNQAQPEQEPLRLRDVH